MSSRDSHPRVGIIGLGRLGLPVACAMASRGHQVYGFDLNEQRMADARAASVRDIQEPGLNDLLSAHASSLTFADLPELCERSEIIFLAVQTPHPSEMDGTKRYLGVPKDFDYRLLTGALTSVAQEISHLQGHRSLVIISTVAPGTTRRILLPIMHEHLGELQNWSLTYSPSFIALGSVISDFLSPSFWLLGGGDSIAYDQLSEFYTSLSPAPVLEMSWEEAEITKLAINAFQSMKIIYANTIAHMCHSLDYKARAQTVLDAVKRDTKRAMGPKYLNPGLPVGGPCLPRDLQALAWFSDTHALGYNLFNAMSFIRERQALWLARRLMSYQLPCYITGKAYKAGLTLTDGSPSLLVASIVQTEGARCEFWEPGMNLMEPIALLVGTQDAPLPETLPLGSKIIDPWGVVKLAPVGAQIVNIA